LFSGKRMEESAPTLNLADVRRIIEPLYEGQKLFTGESVMAHAEGVVDILRGIRDDDDLLAAAYLFCVWNQLKNPKEWPSTSANKSANSSQILKSLLT